MRSCWGYSIFTRHHTPHPPPSLSHTNIHPPTSIPQAAVLIVAIELTKLKVKRKLAHEQERVWEEANYIYGAFLRLAFFRLKARGWWHCDVGLMHARGFLVESGKGQSL